MSSCLGYLGQPFFGDELKYGIMLFGFPDNRPDRPVLASIQHKEFVNGLAGAECLQHRIAPFYDIFIYLLVFFHS